MLTGMHALDQLIHAKSEKGSFGCSSTFARSPPEPSTLYTEAGSGLAGCNS